jgi:hypothetical protein
LPLGRYLAVRYASRVAPLLSTSTVLFLARWWHQQGAAHSVGDAVLMCALAGAAGIAGTVNACGQSGGKESLSTLCFAAAGAFAVTGVAAYSNGLALPLLMWAITTLTTYAISAHFWRQDKRQASADRHQLSVETLRARTTVQTAFITGAAQIEAARQRAAGEAAQVAAIEEAWHHRRALDLPAQAEGFRRLEMPEPLTVGQILKQSRCPSGENATDKTPPV